MGDSPNVSKPLVNTIFEHNLVQSLFYYSIAI